jgi:hypothetical protein
MGTESTVSPERRKFIDAVRANNFRNAYRAITCMKMKELLWSFASVMRFELEAFWCNKNLVANDSEWDLQRLEYAMNVVRNRKLPKSKLKLEAGELKDVQNYISNDRAYRLILTEDPSGLLPAPNPGASRLSSADYEAAAKEFGSEVAALLAVAEVESRDSGFQRDGRPKILFEAHYFRRLTGRKFDASHPHLSTTSGNSPDYYSWDQWSRMYEAMTLDYEAAWKSASWGRFQIMGEYHQSLCEKTLRDFVNVTFVSEQEHLKLFKAYCRNKRVVRHLVQKNWKSFAEGFNGLNQVGYDTKMAAAYKKYAKPQTLAKGTK